MTDVDRAVAMAASVRKAVRALGVDEVGVDYVGRAHSLAMKPRLASLDDDHHPAYLHPGRSVLIMTRDVSLADPLALAAASLMESETEELRVSASEIEEELGPALAATLAGIPGPGDERLVERLVTLPELWLLATLAERLDQLRHAHLMHDSSGWSAMHDEVGRVWLPVAERTHAKLAQRYEHWFRTFAKRVG